MGQEARCIELLDRHAAAAIGKKVHSSAPQETPNNAWRDNKKGRAEMLGAATD
jgi:hypothetical protein